MADPDTTQQAQPTAEEAAGAARAERLNEILYQRGQQHNSVLQSQSLALRSRQQVINEEIAQQRFDVSQQNVELARIRALAEIEKQRVVTKMAIQEHQQLATAISQLGQLDPNDPQYTMKMAKIFNENPMASKDPVITEIVKSNIASRHVVEETGAHIAEVEAAQDAEKARILALRDDADARQKAGVPLKVQIAAQEAGARERASVGADFARSQLNDINANIENNRKAFSSETDQGKRDELVQQYKDLYNQKDALMKKYDLSNTAPVSPSSSEGVPISSGTQNVNEDTEAVNWAKQNPDDPRSKKILELNPQ